jgi:tetrapyrrole methylase family protein/MazG family protein
MSTAADAFAELVQIMEKLRAPGGCPWDREQTHASIKPYLIEEAYEVAEAIDSDNVTELRKELGDLLLQIVFHSEMAREAGRFTIDDVVRGINEKMVRRHPHVFAGVAVKDSDEVLRNWSKIKAEERKEEADRSALAGVPRALPALSRAHRLAEKAAHVGFDWPNAAGVLSKVREELAELEEALQQQDNAAIEAEIGDLLFATTSLARHLDLHAEDALQRASDRFLERFRFIEQRLGERQQDVHSASAAELDELWEEAKRALR